MTVVDENEVVEALAEMGLRDRVVLLHARLSALGWLIGGSVALIQALLRAVGPRGTLVMPSFTTYLSHPAAWRRQSIPAELVSRVAANLPAFDPERHKCDSRLGATAETFRTGASARRSEHPLTSFSAQGPAAAQLVGGHLLTEPRFGTNSPLGALRAADALVLLLGAPWSSCTGLHLSESEVPYRGRRMAIHQVPSGRPGRAISSWLPVRDFLYWEGDFESLGDAYEHSRPRELRRCDLAGGRALSTPLRSLDSFAQSWLAVYRDLSRYRAPSYLSDVTDASTGSCQ